MTEDQTPDETGPVLFDALLTPHRSLSAPGFLVLMAVVCGFGFCAGVGFYLVGAWPVIAFLGADVLLIYAAFRVSYRRAKMYEVLRLTPRTLTVRRVDHWGGENAWRFPAAWLQVLIDDPPRHGSELVLRSHGRSLVIGSFLTPGERLEVAQALRAALSQSRTAPSLS